MTNKIIGTFDEAAYLSTNEDVAEAVKRGELRSGEQHYLEHGLFEGRIARYDFPDRVLINCDRTTK